MENPTIEIETFRSCVWLHQSKIQKLRCALRLGSGQTLSNHRRSKTCPERGAKDLGFEHCCLTPYPSPLTALPCPPARARWAESPYDFRFWIFDFRFQDHRITRSALAKTLGAMVNPICLAAFRLMMNSNFIGCSTGRSAGLAPLRILSTYVAARRCKSIKFTP
jgi:hypothetical protein